jgi:3-hydroxymyristoyl/3-hydroxydecanoyl-(acyl carrier protein) dehydratase
MEPSGRFCIPASHPSLPGHFPGHPVVPGVVLLEEALACLPPGLRLITAKFTAPVHAGAMVEVSSRATGGGRFAFICSVSGSPVLHGVAGAAP